MASVDKMDVRNITEAGVNLYDTPHICGINRTDVENISAGTDAVEKTMITEKLGESPGIDESVEKLWIANSSSVEIPRQCYKMIS